MSFDEAPEPPMPEDDPKGYADYLRRQVVATLRKYLTCRGEEGLIAIGSYCAHENPTMEDVAQAVRELDEWKKEFAVDEID